MKTNKLNRRTFLVNSALAGSALSFFPAPGICRVKSPSEKLNIACVGIKHRGGANVAGVKNENIVALCDIDDLYLEEVGAKFPNAKRFFDFREMLSVMGDKIDGVTVSTTDHTHASVALAVMKRGLHCYCEKPLAHTVEEVRKMVAVAKEKRLVTQTGIQIHATENYRRVLEYLRAGAIGTVTSATIWTPAGPAGIVPPTDKVPCPKNLHWDQWIGPAPWRPYHPCYLPGIWRRWWDFGSGRFGDMACHLTDLVFWALDIRTPISAQAKGPTNVHPTAAPPTLDIDYLFKREDRKSPDFHIPEVDPHSGRASAIPAVDPFPVHWKVGTPPELLKQLGDEYKRKSSNPSAEQDLKQLSQGILFIGTEGTLLCNYNELLLYPSTKYAKYAAPGKSIVRSEGHHAEWLKGIRENDPTDSLCNFEYGAALTESVMLGNISYRAGQKKILWDRAAGRITNLPEANAFLKKEYRKGWELE